MDTLHAIRTTGRLAALASILAAWAAPAAAEASWIIAGRQGIIFQVVVPVEQAGDREAYVRQVPVICGDSETCFVNFYTNATGAAVSLPLPDAIAEEATAVLRRSAKQGVEGFRWSCRMKKPEPNCF